MPRIFRVWIDIDEYDPITDQWFDVQVDLPPTGEFIANADGDVAAARSCATAFASRLHETHERIETVTARDREAS
jgi:hypothetical protein